MQQTNSFTRRTATVAALAIAVLGAACNKDSTNTAPSVATAITATGSSNAQSGTAGQALATPITVHVVDQNGHAMTGTVVTWTVGAGSGSTDAPTSTTNGTGDASVNWTLGTAAGTQTMTASLAGGASVVVTATANAGSVTAMSKESGDAQTVTPGQSGAAFVVKATDQYGNAVSGVTVTWLSVDGGSLDVSSSVTGADGKAQAVLTTTSTAQTYNVVAAAGAAITATFTLIAQ